MNGIIHNCTHKETDSITFRMTEEEQFVAIFNYIEHLFGKIKPKKLFFMAIDGVAPRAKMNQQRARRFRTALDAENARQKAIREGTEMPKEEPFDSNCITPGTAFMAKLSQQLKYFVNKKVSEDADWQGVEIVLSGHEVPGEGEHKIMEYIRLAKAQSDYEHNVRHCLYGLDADLIMLGLLSHDPHFCLLREEVKFGRQTKSSKPQDLEHQNFYLMHLCLVREYLELEFQELKEPGKLDFPFDLERIIDDFILMCFFVGNDFLPNLPNLHINEGVLYKMFEVYKQMLPTIGGYINDGGVINMPHLAELVKALTEHLEKKFFKDETSNDKFLKGKRLPATRAEPVEELKKEEKGVTTLSTTQSALWKQLRKFYQNRPEGFLEMPSTLPAGDSKVVQKIAEELKLQWRTAPDDSGRRHIQIWFPDAETEDDEDDVAMPVIRKYDNAKIVDVTAQGAEAQKEIREAKMYDQWKDKYYEGKFEWKRDNEVELTKLAENYVQGLQWVLFYYYKGVASWSWFYHYHYAPMISDILKGLNANTNFELGQPFHPYEQLMGVQPARSKNILPSVYHELMTDEKSPIIDFYPSHFDLDMNGKKSDWEAIVKIPFIDEKRLLDAMAPRNKLLSDDEKARNEFGVSLKFMYAPEVDFTYPSSLVGRFQDLAHCHCVESAFDLPTVDGTDYYVGLMENAKLGENALAGFPTLGALPYTAELDASARVNIFQQESKNESMVLTLSDTKSKAEIESAKSKLGQKVYVGYPFLQEAKVVCVFNAGKTYRLAANGLIEEHGSTGAGFSKKAGEIKEMYTKKKGVDIGDVESLMEVEMLKGMKMLEDGATVKDYGNMSGMEAFYASQVIVDEVVNEDQRLIEKKAVPIVEEFPIGSLALYMDESYYGRAVEIKGHNGNKADVQFLSLGKEPKVGREVIEKATQATRYLNLNQLVRSLPFEFNTLNMLTSSVYVTVNGKSLDFGLSLKNKKQELKVPGYTRLFYNNFEYSEKALILISEFITKFPEFPFHLERLLKEKRNMIYSSGGGKSKDEFRAEDFPGVDFQEMNAWLKEKGVRDFEKVAADVQQLEPEVVKTLEASIDKIVKAAPAPDTKEFKSVARGALLKPSEVEHVLGNQKFILGDRAVYAQDSGRVPIFTRGTVVGTSVSKRTTFLDILFDETFMSGTNLGGRCSAQRGSTVPITSVLNLSNPQFVIDCKTGHSKRPKQLPQQMVTATGYGAPAGPGARGQFREAPVPQPMHGSYGGIAAGQAYTNGAGRGRGGAGMVSYNAQPPPASLHAGRGGRGGRGRGGMTFVGTPSQDSAAPMKFGDLPIRGGPPQQQQVNEFNGGRNGEAGFVPRGGAAPRGRGGVRGAPQQLQNGFVGGSMGEVGFSQSQNPRGGAIGRGRGYFRGRGRGGRDGQGQAAAAPDPAQGN